MHSNWIYKLSPLALGAVLVACGGGGSDGGPEVSTAENLSGIAISTAPITGASVTVRCVGGVTANTTTDGSGAWATDAIVPSALPCAVQLRAGQVGDQPFTQSLQIVATARGNLNLTPLSDFAMASALGNDYTANWFDTASDAVLNAAADKIRSGKALAQTQDRLRTLPAKPELPHGQNVLTGHLEAKRGNAIYDVNQAFVYALGGARVPHAQALELAAQGKALTKEAFAFNTYTTPNMTTFRSGYSVNLDGSTILSIPDPHRGVQYLPVRDVPATLSGEYREIARQEAGTFGQVEITLAGGGFVWSVGSAQASSWNSEVDNYFLLNAEAGVTQLLTSQVLGQRFATEMEVIDQARSNDEIFLFIATNGRVYEEVRPYIGGYFGTQYGPMRSSVEIGHVNDLTSDKGILSKDGSYKMHAVFLKIPDALADGPLNKVVVVTRTPVSGDILTMGRQRNTLAVGNQDFTF